MLITCIVLAAAFISALIYIVLLKRDIRQLWLKLNEINQSETNTQLTTQTTDKDIISLTKSINVMIEESHLGLLEKVRSENELKRALTNISHDLRTPLTSARGFLQMLHTGDLDVDTQSRYLETVMGRLDTLSTLMNSLFEFTQVIEGRTEITLRRLNISSVLRESIAAFYPELCKMGFTIDTDIPEIPVYALADKDVLLRVLQNVLRNVVIHGIDFIRVQLIPNGEIVISNCVQNIDAIDVERLFERFYTTDASRTAQGTGLGLAIVKELVIRMNGHITVEIEGNMLSIRIRLLLFKESR